VTYIFPRDAMQAQPVIIHAVSVRLSVPPSASLTFVHSVETNKHAFKLLSPKGR